MNGNIEIEEIETGCVEIGFGNVGIFDKKFERSVLELCNNSVLKFKGKALLGHGSKISVQGNAVLTLGSNFVITANSSIICAKNIKFGDNCLLSWEILVMDSDLHSITDKSNSVVNKPRPISIGNNVWIGARSTILKGSMIGSDNVVGAESLVLSVFDTTNSIIAGSPAKIIKRDIKWHR